MRHDPSDAHWLGRDRFVLSCGHSSLTLYLQLYLGGFGLELSDIESLRTWGSKTPGHPEFRHTKGVEITTGPLGQGLASAVGFAMAARYERGLFDPGRRSRDQPVRPPHLRDRLRRRHGRGSDLGGVIAGRRAAAGQPHRVLRPQRDLDRGRHQHRVVRGHRRPLRGVRLACAARRGRRERRRHRRGHRQGQGGHRQAVVHLGADDHRLPGAEVDEHRQGTRLSARRRRSRGGQEDPRIRSGQEVRGPRRGDRPHPRAGAARQGQPTRSGTPISRRGPSASPSARNCWTG